VDFLALAQTTPHIETLWPTSLVALIGSLTAVLTFFMLLVMLWRADKKPVLASIAEAKNYFQQELTAVKEEFTDKVNAQQAHIDHSLDSYHETVTGEINGWAKRFTDDHGDIQRHELAIGEIVGKLIESRADREQLNRRVDGLAREVSENTKETRQIERNLTTQIGEMERRLVDVITGRKRPT
jgi:septal ring factor EnvC (AmiA/AmiB activator)